ncbi:serine hydrolase domain-containing protein [Mycolicibacterium sp. 120270]|uniref:serine hydrolase domain-containing protein n=1 Tax=Mycolicibacterium sp. 120270 TaxID=3090600 RepID=UPI00299DD8BC|nr:serine hydrolase domain-containing protein [Mycolicibacterium sp. 120270]MDX1887171.1 serine hydrolase domain-containing protein [Mycolicibacterium sp. 120270]
MGALRLVSAVIAAVVLGMAVGVARAQAVPEGDLAGQLDSAIEARIAAMGVPGAIVSLDVPGEISYTKAFGVADTSTGDPMAFDDHFRIGSVTKTFTGTAILQLVDQGRLRLTDPISRYVDGVPSGDIITLDLLARMRSGLADYSETDTFLSRVYAESPIGPDAFAPTPRELVDAAFAEPMAFAPGTDWKYCNTNTLLLGMVIENVSGLSLGEYFQQNIFGPVGLTATSYPSNGLMPIPYSHGYTKAPDGQILDASMWNPVWAGAAGEIVSTTADMSTWAAALGKGTLLRPDTQANRLRGGFSPAPGLAYDFAIFTTHGWRGHNGDIPGYATVAVYLPERDATLVVFVNSDVPEQHSAGQIAYDVTKIATPEHLYEVGPKPPELLREPGD